jgi:hypothetical protein
MSALLGIKPPVCGRGKVLLNVTGLLDLNRPAAQVSNSNAGLPFAAGAAAVSAAFVKLISKLAIYASQCAVLHWCYTEGQI